MSGYARYRIYKYTEFAEDGSVKKTQHVASVWLPIVPRTDEEQHAIAKAWKGDELGSPDPADYDFMAKNRDPRYSQQIVENLRYNNKELFKEFTDDQLYNAYSHWNNSSDFPDETLIVHWISRK